MKRHFLKNSLVTLTFSLAIIASLAFSNAVEEGTFIQLGNPPSACDAVSVACSDCQSGNFACTYQLGSTIYDVYSTKESSTCWVLCHDDDDDPDNN